MKPVTFHPKAQDEVDGAAAWYEGAKAGLGREFRTEFEADRAETAKVRS